MLTELAVTDLGVIEELALVLGPGMTAVTGETGAGKTLVVEAIELLMGGRAEPSMVRHGASEAVIEGRFDIDGVETVLRRVVPADGRSRAYVDGRLATAGSLAELGRALADLHGQHDHQSLLAASVQRAALDRFGGVDLTPLLAARDELHDAERALTELGGDERSRARESDLLRFQVDEIDGAGLSDPDEDEHLEALEGVLADAGAHQEAARAALVALDVDEGAASGLAEALAALDGRAPFTELVGRLRGVEAELADITTEVRQVGESIEDDPAQLAELQERRRRLHELRRKYGDDLAAVMAFRDEAATRLAQLDDRDRLAAELEAQMAELRAAVARAEAEVGRARRAAAPALAAAVREHLRELAMPQAELEIEVGDDPGDDVVFLLAANVGAPALPLAKVASGGELARSMLALRLVLSEAPPTLVFDEVDAGIGGAAATAVGRSLASLADRHQVLVVTHLPQVAAWATTQVGITKHVRAGTTLTTAAVLAGADREVELARMLSGSPGSSTARRHAAELLEQSRAAHAPESSDRALR
jgi:DNA repair protein RecN (Recombination protein N)